MKYILTSIRSGGAATIMCGHRVSSNQTGSQVHCKPHFCQKNGQSMQNVHLQDLNLTSRSRDAKTPERAGGCTCMFSRSTLVCFTMKLVQSRLKMKLAIHGKANKPRTSNQAIHTARALTSAYLGSSFRSDFIPGSISFASHKLLRNFYAVAFHLLPTGCCGSTDLC